MTELNRALAQVVLHKPTFVRLVVFGLIAPLAVYLTNSIALSKNQLPFLLTILWGFSFVATFPIVVTEISENLAKRTEEALVYVECVVAGVWASVFGIDIVCIGVIVTLGVFNILISGGLFGFVVYSLGVALGFGLGAWWLVGPIDISMSLGTALLVLGLLWALLVVAQRSRLGLFQEQESTRTALNRRTHQFEAKSPQAHQEDHIAKGEAIDLKKESQNQIQALSAALPDLKGGQERLVMQARMATLGKVAAGVAHEIRNPLTLTLGGVDDLRERLESLHTTIGSATLGENHREQFEAELKRANQLVTLIERGGQRIEGIVKNLSDFVYSGTQPRSHDCNLAANIGVVVALLDRRGSEKSIEVTTQVEKNLVVRINKTELNQVLMNILLNAFQAVGPGGKVDLIAESYGGTIRLHIFDNGPGIDSSIRKQLFEPFFTTRESLGGTGLGLAISHSIMSNCGGSLSLGDSREVGAEFVLVFPAARHSEVAA